MSLKCGIVGLPNVGKSTLFNAITNTSNAQAENYPFCTIEPNIGRVEVPDERLEKLELFSFDDDANVVHVNGKTDPVSDLQTIETELQLADIATLEKIITNNEKKAKSRNEDAILQLETAKKIMNVISDGKMASDADLDDNERKIAKQFCLLTAKNAIYVANVDENSLNGNNYTTSLDEFLAKRNAKSIIICASTEAEISTFSKEEKMEYLKSINCQESGLDKVVKAGYSALELITFFTVGPKETRAWQVKNNATAPEAAGEIHTDFQKGFIKAETISYEDYIKYSNEEAIKEAGKLRTEGKDYIVQDGDIFNFKFNV